MRKNRALLLSLAVFFCAILTLFISYPTVSPTLGDSKISMPFLKDTQNNYIFDFSFQIKNRPEIFSKYRIIPDDCAETVSFNGNSIVLDIANNGRCDYKKGFLLKIEGDGLLNIKVINNGGKGGVNLYPVVPDALLFFIFAPLVLIFMLLAKRVGVGYFIAAILAIGFIFRLYYTGETQFDIRAHDVVGHIDYIKYLANHFALPAKNDCYQCYHPPLYYVPAALIYYISSFFDENVALKSLQLFSVLLFMTALVFGVLTIREFVKDRFLFFIAVLFLVFTPSMVIHSARIGNDAMLYPLYFGALYYLTVWFKYGASRHLYLAATLAALSILAKSNGIIIVGIFSTVTVALFIKKLADWQLDKKFSKSLALSFGVLFLGFVLNFSTTIYENISHKSNNLLVGNVTTVNSGLKVGTDVVNFVKFDLDGFVSEPFTSAWKDGKGREYFLNYTFKTALFGEFDDFENKNSKTIASILSFLFLFVLAANLFWLVTLKKGALYTNLIPLLNLVLPLIALAYFRYSIPQACSNDFRYILPQMLSMIVVFAIFIESVKERGYLLSSLFLKSISIVFVTLSVMLFM